MLKNHGEHIKMMNIFGRFPFGGIFINLGEEEREIMDVDYEDLTPEQPKGEEIIEDYTEDGRTE